MTDFSIKQGSIAPSLTLVPRDGLRQPIAWVEGTTATFRLWRIASGQVVVDSARAVAYAGTVDGQQALVVRYDWQPGDTDLPGQHAATVDILIPGYAGPMTFPTGTGGPNYSGGEPSHVSIMVEPRDA